MLIFVDCEAPFNKGSPSVADMTQFGAVAFPSMNEFYGKDCSLETLTAFKRWLPLDPEFISDNPAYDWQWINFYFWKYFAYNPFGHSARRIGDFYAGLTNGFNNTQEWKEYRQTKHDHNPVHDARGNAEAFIHILSLIKKPE